MMKKILSLFTIPVFLVACSTGPDGQPQLSKEKAGGIAGAVAGGVLGSNIGDGKGRLIATGAGTLLGALAGSEIGRSLDKADRLYAQQALSESHNAPLGETITWNNNDSGNRGSYTPIREGRTPDGGPCRQYEQTIIVNGQAETGVGTACQNEDGTWQIVNN